MVEYSDFTQWSFCSITVTEYPKYEARCKSYLASLCGDNWSESDDICKNALMNQIEYVFQNGGLSIWASTERSGGVRSESYTTGGESETRQYSGYKRNYPLPLSPVAEQILKNAGYLSVIGRVRVCY